MVNELKPFIDSKYRTLSDRDHTFIAGSSMGGLMSLYALLKYNHVFSRAAALSPSIWFAVNKLDELIKNSYLDSHTILYMDYGSRELRHHANMRQQFIKVSSSLLRRHIMLETRIVPYGDHCEASWEKQIPIFMNTLLYDL